jgi:hypothetical protein
MDGRIKGSINRCTDEWIEGVMGEHMK